LSSDNNSPNRTDYPRETELGPKKKIKKKNNKKTTTIIIIIIIIIITIELKINEY